MTIYPNSACGLFQTTHGVQEELTMVDGFCGAGTVAGGARLAGFKVSFSATRWRLADSTCLSRFFLSLLVLREPLASCRPAC